MGNLRFLGLITLLTGVFLLGCAPGAAPAPTPATTPGPAPSAPALPAQTSAPVSAEDVAWARVVEEARREGSVTLYSYAFTGEVGDAVRRAFEGKYGIKVDIVAGLGSVMMPRIKSEQVAKKYVADTFDTALTFVNLTKEDGLTQSWGELPVLREKDIWSPFPRVDNDGHMMAIGQGWFNIYINTNLVSPAEEPKSYKELLQPRWKGKGVIGHPATTPNTVLLYMTGKKYGFLEDDYFRQLVANNVVVAANVRESGDRVMRGESYFQFTGANITYNRFIKEGAAVKVVPMEEGSLRYLLNPLALVRNAPHANAARVFMNWFLSKEGQTVYHQAASTSSHRKDVPDFAPPGGKFVAKRVLDVDMAMEIEAGKVQRERVVDKLLGLER